MSSHEQKRDAGEASAQALRTWTDRALIVGAAGLALYALLQVMQYRFGRDQGIYAVVADSMLHGGMPYRDAWDFKPPGIYFVYALAQALFGAEQWGIRLASVLCLISLVPAFMTLSRRWFGTRLAGLLGAGIAILIDAQLEFWHTAQPEFFGGVVTVLGLVLATDERALGSEPTSKRAWACWIGAGACFGIAGLMKPQMMGASAAAAVYLIAELRTLHRGWKQSAVPAIALTAGTVLAVALCAIWFLSRGAWGDLHHTLFVFAPGYGATTWYPEWFPNYLYYAAELFAAGSSGFLFVGLVLGLCLPPTHARERRGWMLVGAVIVVHLVGIAVQSKFFPYHFGGTYPLGALLAGHGFYKLWRRCQSRGAWALALFVVLVWFLTRSKTATRDLNESYWDRSSQRCAALLEGADAREKAAAKLNSVADVDYAQNMAVVRWLKEQTAPGDSVYIWGFEPFIYHQAKRRPASRYIYNVPQRVAWFRDESRERLMQDLRATQPRAIVVEHRDVFPVVTGDALDSAASLETFWELKTMLDTQYLRVHAIGDFDLYLRR